MAHKENLISFKDMDPERAREIRSKGGHARVAALKAKKSRREWAKIIGSLPVEVVKPDGKALPAADLDAAMIIGLYRKAAAGNERAARLLLELHGDLEQTVRIDPVPKTGDSNIVLYAALACAGSFSLAALTWALIRHRTRRREEKENI